MSPSARLSEETSFQRCCDGAQSKLLRCIKCLVEFKIESDYLAEPKFCPNCGRRAA